MNDKTHMKSVLGSVYCQKDKLNNWQRSASIFAVFASQKKKMRKLQIYHVIPLAFLLKSERLDLRASFIMSFILPWTE